MSGGPLLVRHAAAPAVALFLLAVLVYLPAMQGGFLWDDDDYVSENETLRSVEGLARIWVEPGATPQYYPLVFTTYWLEYRAWGAAPAGYHAVNALLHAVAAVLLGFLLRRLAVPGAWIAAAVFALHPVHVESVAWITERKNVLSGALYLGAALAWWRSVESSRRFPALAFVLFAAALLAKSVTATLPAAFLLVIWWKRGRIGRRDGLVASPFFALGLAAGLTTLAMERSVVGATGADFDLSFAERLLIAGRAIFFYVGKLVGPVDLAFFYPRWTIDAGSAAQWAWPVGVMAVIGGLAVLAGRAGRSARGPAAGPSASSAGRGALVAVLFFAGTLFPALGFFDVYPMRFSFVADHFQYLASIGPIAGLVAAGALGFRRASRRGGGGAGGLGRSVTLLILATLATLTGRRQAMYRDVETLWETTLRANPEAWLAHNNLGTLRQEQGRLDEAMVHYRRATEIAPNDPLGWDNIGNVLHLRGEVNAAVASWREALRADPDLVETRNRLATTLTAAGSLDEAAAELSEAIRRRPDYPPSHLHLGQVLLRQGRPDLAARQYARAIQLAPEFAEAHHDLGVSLAQGGAETRALAAFREAIRLQPDWPRPVASAARLLATARDPAVRDLAEAKEMAEGAERMTGTSASEDPYVRETLEMVRAVVANGEATGR